MPEMKVFPVQWRFLSNCEGFVKPKSFCRLTFLPEFSEFPPLKPLKAFFQRFGKVDMNTYGFNPGLRGGELGETNARRSDAEIRGA